MPVTCCPALQNCLNHAEELTPETKTVALYLVKEIKQNEPTWSELHWINKIIDVLTLGVTALYRYGTFKKLKEEYDLDQAAEEDLGPQNT